MHSVSKLDIINEVQVNSVPENSIQSERMGLTNPLYFQYGTECVIHSHLSKKKREIGETSVSPIEIHFLMN